MRCQCVICTDNFDGTSAIASVPCGHTFHDACINKWIRNSPTCPSCRIRVRACDVRKVFLNSLDETLTGASSLENELFEARARIHDFRLKLDALREDNTKLKVIFKKKETEVGELKQKYYKAVEEVTTLKAKTSSLGFCVKENEELKKAVSELKDIVEKTNHIKAVLNGTTNDVEDLLKTYGPGENSLRQISTFCVLIKRELNSCKAELRSARDETACLRRQLVDAAKELSEKTAKLENVLAEHTKLRKEFDHFSQCFGNSENQHLTQMDKGSPRARSSLKRNAQNALSNDPTKVSLVDEKLDMTVVPSPSAPTSNSMFLSNRKVMKLKQTFKAPPGYSTMKIVTGLKKQEENSKDSEDDLILKMMLRKATPKAADNDSKVRTGYNGLGGHSNFIQKKKSIW